MAERAIGVRALAKHSGYSKTYICQLRLGQRDPSREAAQDLDDALGANGGLAALAPKKPPAQRSKRADGHTREVERVHNGTLPAAATADTDTVDVPYRDSTGRIIYVSVPRRVFMASAGLAAFAAAVPGTDLREMHPADHFLRARAALRDTDNLYGPRDVVPLVTSQLQIMDRLAHQLRGEDRRRLLVPQIQFADLLGWLYQDSCDYASACHWLDRSLEWAHLLGDTTSVVFILSRKAQLATDNSEAGEAIALAETAMRHAHDNDLLRSVAATYGAHAYALDGDATTSGRLYDDAHSSLPPQSSNGTPWAKFLDHGYIDVYRAQSRAALGENDAAAEGFAYAISQIRPDYYRDRGVYIAREALCRAAGHDLDHAASLGLQALTIGAETRSARILTELATLDRAFTAAPVSHATTRFQDALAQALPAI
jgi:hypothetical protein